MRIGVICSAGGGAFFSALDIMKAAGKTDQLEVTMVTDRECDAERAAIQLGIGATRLDLAQNRDFSAASLEHFKGVGCEMVILFYTRLVTMELFGRLPTHNIHPSLLPAFRGIGALAQSKRAGVKILGATLHEVTEEVDRGRILAQASSPVSSDMTRETLNRISFIQKTYLTLVFFEFAMGIRSTRLTMSASPALQSDDLIAAFRAFLSERPEATFAP